MTELPLTFVVAANDPGVLNKNLLASPCLQEEHEPNLSYRKDTGGCIDLDDCSSISLNPQWHFFQDDDVRFAGLFREFCAARGIAPAVDLLFIDTSHYYDHTVQEIAAWFPYLSEKAKVMFHDTNLRLMGLGMTDVLP